MKIQLYSASVLIVLSQCLLQTAGFINNLYNGVDPNQGIRHRGRAGKVKLGSSVIYADVLKRMQDNKGPSDTNELPSKTAYILKRGYDSIYAVAEPQNVGFQASLSFSTTVIRRDPTIRFDTVQEGIPDKSVFDVTSGVFESPVSGVYLVSFTLATQEDGDVVASVYLRRRGRNRGEKRLSVVANGQNGTSQGSITGFITMNHGDKLNAEVDHPGIAKIFGNDLTSLSVYLVKKL